MLEEKGPGIDGAASLMFSHTKSHDCPQLSLWDFLTSERPQSLFRGNKHLSSQHNPLYILPGGQYSQPSAVAGLGQATQFLATEGEISGEVTGKAPGPSNPSLCCQDN